MFVMDNEQILFNTNPVSSTLSLSPDVLIKPVLILHIQHRHRTGLSRPPGWRLCLETRKMQLVDDLAPPLIVVAGKEMADIFVPSRNTLPMEDGDHTNVRGEKSGENTWGESEFHFTPN
jgi:hypothetical protein